MSSPNLLGEYHLVRLMADFLRNCPSLEIELNFYSRKVDLIEDAYDVAIQVGARTDINVVNRVLTTTTFKLVASPHFLNQNGTPGTPQDLKHLRCLHFMEYGVNKPWRFRKGETELSIRGKSYWQSNNGHCLLSAARAGVGIAYLPDYYLAEDLRQGTLVSILDDWTNIERDIVAVYQHKRHLSAKVKLFVDFLESQLKAQRPW